MARAARAVGAEAVRRRPGSALREREPSQGECGKPRATKRRTGARQPALPAVPQPTVMLL
jgi:hypothetical protein